MTATLITCPMHAGGCGGTLNCGDEQVIAYGFGEFDATQIRVMPCSSLIAQGWAADEPQLIEAKSRADYLLPAPAQPLQHRDGLVIIG